MDRLIDIRASPANHPTRVARDAGRLATSAGGGYNPPGIESGGGTRVNCMAVARGPRSDITRWPVALLLACGPASWAAAPASPTTAPSAAQMVSLNLPDN